MVYIFDIASIGKDCFSEGIANIIEDKNILKVSDVRLTLFLIECRRGQKKTIRLLWFAIYNKIRVFCTGLGPVA